MKKKRTAPVVDVPRDIEDLRRQVEQWRLTRQHREPMPPPLWDMAARLAQKHSVARVARIARLEYPALKKRLNSPDSEHDAKPKKRPAFIEMRMPFSAPLPECIIDLDHSGGSRMRIHVKGGPALDFVALIRGFQGTES